LLIAVTIAWALSGCILLVMVAVQMLMNGVQAFLNR
jgi:hypothetical protein